MSDRSLRPLEPEDLEYLQKLVAEHGHRGTARVLDLSRQTIDRGLAGLPVQRRLLMHMGALRMKRARGDHTPLRQVLA